MAENLKIVKTLEKLNRVINRSAMATKFVSLFYGELDVTRNFVYSNCGHPPPLLYHGGQFQELSEGGPVLGPSLGMRYMRGYVTLRPGDVLVLYTDGLSEAASADDAEFGTDRIRRIVADHARRPAAEIVDRLFRAVQDHSGLTTPRDDQTVMVAKAR